MKCVTTICLLCCCVTPAVVIGCRGPQRLEVSSAGTPLFDEFHAEYRFSDARQRLARRFATDSHSISRASGSRGSSSSSADQEPRDRRVAGRDHGIRPMSWEHGGNDAILTVECPHPSGDPSSARVSLKFTPDATEASESDGGTRSLTVPRTHVELLIVELARSGFFDNEGPTRSLMEDAGTLHVRIDRGRTRRAWPADDRLLDLAHRVLTTADRSRRPPLM